MTSILLNAEGLTKSFGANLALDGVELTLRAGEIHALVGHNGSGKSTLIKVLAGFHEPDGGKLTVRGQEVELPITAGETAALGLRFVHQDLAIVDDMPIVDNLIVNDYLGTAGMQRIRWRDARQRATRLLREFGLETSVDQPAGDLAQAERAVLAIVRCLALADGEESGVLVLDEPTAALRRDETALLFDAVRQSAARGWAVLFVSHHLGEVLGLCDHVTALREGKCVASRSLDGITEDDLIEMIVGTKLDEIYPESGDVASGRPVVLRSRIETGKLAQTDVVLRAGEIVGFTGIAGMGQDEIPEVLAGALPGATTEVAGEPVGNSVKAALDAGIALVPANRARFGADLGSSIVENLTLPVLRRFQRTGLLRHREEESKVQQALDEYGVQPSDPTALMRSLSGGNQQKALLAKWLNVHGEVRVLVLHEPTQGVDVGSRHDVFALVRRAADNGMAIVYVSNEHADLAHLCDRVLVMRDGAVAAELTGAALSEHSITSACLASAAGTDPTITASPTTKETV